MRKIKYKEKVKEKKIKTNKLFYILFKLISLIFPLLYKD